MSETGWIVLTISIFAAFIGLVYLIKRASKRQQQTGRRPIWMRIAAFAAGLGCVAIMVVGNTYSFEFIVAAVVLLGYGLFGLFATARHEPWL